MEATADHAGLAVHAMFLTFPCRLTLKCARAFSSFSPALHTYFCSSALSSIFTEGYTCCPAERPGEQQTHLGGWTVYRSHSVS